MTDVKAVMENKPQHWTQLGKCRGDDRFTGKFEWLTVADWREMNRMCLDCPVLRECDAWASDPSVTDVFAARYWRFGPDE